MLNTLRRISWHARQDGRMTQRLAQPGTQNSLPCFACFASKRWTSNEPFEWLLVPPPSKDQKIRAPAIDRPPSAPLTRDTKTNNETLPDVQTNPSDPAKSIVTPPLFNKSSDQYWRKRRDLSMPERHRLAIKEKIGPGQSWNPPKKVSRQTMDRIRFLFAQFPDEYTIPHLANEFRISQESVRRMLKSKFQPTADVIERQDHRRKKRIAEHYKKQRDSE